MLLNYLFLTMGISFIICVIAHKLYFSKLKDRIKAGNFVSIMTFFLAFYIIFGLIEIFFIKGITNKILMLLFALSPFIIGKLATYKYEKIYTILQVLCILISVSFIL